jgi:type 2 lantibiotic biosynthesis protein LanM
VRRLRGSGAFVDRVPWIEEACRVAEELKERSRPGRGGALTWQDPESAEGAPLGPHLYSGDAGIALFLAALENITGGRGRYRRLTLAALARLRRRLIPLAADPISAARMNLKLGSMIGLGGFIYTLIRVGQWLDEPNLLEEACRAATLITPERIADDFDLDVAHGSAGALLALLLLDEAVQPATPSGLTPLDRARACAAHLLDRRLSHGGKPRAWRFPYADAPLCGFAHGAAGIAYALLRLYRRTGEETLITAVREGLEYERDHYDRDAKNWRDLRDPSGQSFMMGWCHGAPGIALSRLGMLSAVEDEAIRTDLALALEATRSAALSRADHLCCGNLGRIEVLLYAYQQLGRDDLKQRAASLAWQVLDRGRGAGGTFGFMDLQGRICFHPSLLLGAAGMGFTFLRLADPGALPCLLLLE